MRGIQKMDEQRFIENRQAYRLSKNVIVRLLQEIQHSLQATTPRLLFTTSHKLIHRPIFQLKWRKLAVAACQAPGSAAHDM